MGVIANVSGADLVMYYDDHNPPHIHIKYQGKEFKFDFNEEQFIGGCVGLNHRVMRQVKIYCKMNKNILNKKWEQHKI